jgi:hypothetical protein
VATGWQVAPGPDIAPGMPAAERADYGEVLLQRLRDALAGYSAPDHARPLPGWTGTVYFALGIE